MDMEYFSRERIYERIEWVKEKGCWLVITILAAATVFLLVFWLSLLLLFAFRPFPYSSTLTPEFQVKKNSGHKLYAVFENLPLKGVLCNQDGYVNAGTSMSQEQFCNFKYQGIPKLNGPFDLNLEGLSSLQVKYASVCLLKLPKQSPFLDLNQTELDRPFTSYRYVCQKYRVYRDMRIGNNLNTDSLVFFQVELQLTDKGYAQFEGSGVALRLEEEVSAWGRWMVDYYWIWGLILGLSVAAWAGLFTLVLGLAWMIKRVLWEKQMQQERLLLRIKKQE